MAQLSPDSTDIREKGFVPATRPLNLAQIAETGDSYTLLKEVSIFVIDPLFLALNSVPNDFLNQLAGVLLGDCKFYCVLLPEGLSPELSEKLKSTAKEKLRLAYEDYDKTGRGRWFVRDAAEFRSYLTEHLKPKLKVCQKGRQMTRSGTPQLNMTLEELLSRAADPD